MRLWIFGVILLLINANFYAGFVYGDIYKSDLEKLNRIVVTIDGKFSYRTVTNSTNYSIFLPEGEYRISANYLDQNGNILFNAEEKVNVGEEDQRIDLVLKPANNTEIFVLVLGTGIFAIVVLMF
ncbi:hypothetical protein HYT84_04490, partial [Candidatus Micrarchaeota archaeon]|nr:hypothetical protein [Candidatus Micrarchaeota archaeon]